MNLNSKRDDLFIGCPYWKVNMFFFSPNFEILLQISIESLSLDMNE